MGATSDIETLLGAHFQQDRERKRVRWLIALGSVLASVAASAASTAWVLRGYLEQMPTKTEMAALYSGAQKQIEDVDKKASRVGSVEQTAINAQRDADRANSRLDAHLGGPEKRR